ncbi:MAG: hypothetical protein QOH12_1717 [Solirubrobacteraceae bacterium]|nr:hypothetical protein [Solirubrobacteraceae bacterium]
MVAGGRRREIPLNTVLRPPGRRSPRDCFCSLEAGRPFQRPAVAPFGTAALHALVAVRGPHAQHPARPSRAGQPAGDRAGAPVHDALGPRERPFLTRKHPSTATPSVSTVPDGHVAWKLTFSPRTLPLETLKRTDRSCTYLIVLPFPDVAPTRARCAESPRVRRRKPEGPCSRRPWPSTTGASADTRRPAGPRESARRSRAIPLLWGLMSSSARWSCLACLDSCRRERAGEGTRTPDLSLTRRLLRLYAAFIYTCKSDLSGSRSVVRVAITRDRLAGRRIPCYGAL